MVRAVRAAIAANEKIPRTLPEKEEKQDEESNSGTREEEEKQTEEVTSLPAKTLFSEKGNG